MEYGNELVNFISDQNNQADKDVICLINDAAKVITSNVSAYRLKQVININHSFILGYRNNKRTLQNMQLKNVMKLASYPNKHLSESSLIVLDKLKRIINERLIKKPYQFARCNNISIVQLRNFTDVKKVEMMNILAIIKITSLLRNELRASPNSDDRNHLIIKNFKQPAIVIDDLYNYYLAEARNNNKIELNKGSLIYNLYWSRKLFIGFIKNQKDVDGEFIQVFPFTTKKRKLPKYVFHALTILLEIVKKPKSSFCSVIEFRKLLKNHLEIFNFFRISDLILALVLGILKLDQNLKKHIITTILDEKPDFNINNTSPLFSEHELVDLLYPIDALKWLHGARLNSVIKNLSNLKLNDHDEIMESVNSDPLIDALDNHLYLEHNPLGDITNIVNIKLDSLLFTRVPGN